MSNIKLLVKQSMNYTHFNHCLQSICVYVCVMYIQFRGNGDGQVWFGVKKGQHGESSCGGNNPQIDVNNMAEEVNVLMFVD